MGNETSLNPNALSLADAARLLSRAFNQQVSVALLEADVAAGAPTNADGTINLVRYASWILRGMKNEERSASNASE